MEIIYYSNKLTKEVNQFLEDWDTSDLFYFKTSGTTGEPKEIAFTKTQIITSCNITNEFFDINSNSIVILCLPLNFVAGRMMLYRALVADCKIIITDTNMEGIENIEDTIEVDLISMTSYQLSKYFELLNKFKIKNILIGGAKTVKNDFFRKLKSKIYESYGMTETLTHIALKSLYPEIDKHFRCMSKIEIEQDDRKCLVIKHNDLCKKKIFTNDIIDFIDNKSFNWIGRYDNVINSAGIKVCPEKIEDKLYEYIKKPFFVDGIEDPVFGEKIVLFIESKDNISMNFKKIIENKYLIPKEIIFLDNFEYTLSGKINRKKTVLKYINKKK